MKQKKIYEILILHGELAISHLMQIYMSGKKAIDLIKSLKIDYDAELGKKFSITRNQLSEHNHDSYFIKDLVLEPNFWSVMATNSYLPINIHTNVELEYGAYIDYTKIIMIRSRCWLI